MSSWSIDQRPRFVIIDLRLRLAPAALRFVAAVAKGDALRAAPLSSLYRALAALAGDLLVRAIGFPCWPALDAALAFALIADLVADFCPAD